MHGRAWDGVLKLAWGGVRRDLIGFDVAAAPWHPVHGDDPLPFIAWGPLTSRIPSAVHVPVHVDRSGFARPPARRLPGVGDPVVCLGCLLA